MKINDKITGCDPMPQTIMVVDDSPTIVKFVSFSLKNSGLRVATASDGMDALEKISNMPEDIALIITDLNMPNLDGYGLISTLRQNPNHRQTPIIILSSEDGNDDRERGIEVGASSYLVKPFKPSLLLSEVSKYIKLEIKK
ncbi:MAG: response regulator [candidate division Zixibacteria bacterium]|nr:response regulator [candidate division Zixibacteria bacterium]